MLRCLIASRSHSYPLTRVRAEGGPIPDFRIILKRGYGTDNLPKDTLHKQLRRLVGIPEDSPGLLHFRNVQDTGKEDAETGNDHERQQSAAVENLPLDTLSISIFPHQLLLHDSPGMTVSGLRLT